MLFKSVTLIKTRLIGHPKFKSGMILKGTIVSFFFYAPVFPPSNVYKLTRQTRFIIKISSAEVKIKKLADFFDYMCSSRGGLFSSSFLKGEKTTKPNLWLWPIAPIEKNIFLISAPTNPFLCIPFFPYTKLIKVRLQRERLYLGEANTINTSRKKEKVYTQ